MVFFNYVPLHRAVSLCQLGISKWKWR